MSIASITADLLTSGKAIKVHLYDGSGNSAKPSSVSQAPTVTIDGVNQGALINTWGATGYHKGLVFCLPAGIVATSSSVVTLDAPAAWCNTDLGSAPAMTSQAVTNYTGISVYRPAGYTATLKLGVNLPHNGTVNYALYYPLANWRTRITQGVFGSGSVCKPDGAPTKLGTGGAATFTNMSVSNVIDSTAFPDPVGYWAVYFNDSGNNPASLNSTATSNCTFTELTDRRNNGTAGQGQVRVYQATRKANYTAGNFGLQVVLGPSGGTPTVDPYSIRIYGPGDFTLAPAGTPQTLDVSNDYLVSATFKDRAGVTPSILRWMDSTAFGVAVTQTAMSDPEDMRPMTDFSWGTDTYRTTRTIGLSQIRPYTAAASPYVYSPYFGSTYTATLASPITTTPPALTQEVVTVSDAATAPVFAGQVLSAGSELMRVISVSGTSVTVERGSQGTTPATHAAGTINVQYRTAIADVSWISSSTEHPYYEIVTSTPHGLKTGLVTAGTLTGSYANQTLQTSTISLTKAGGIGAADTVLDVSSTNTGTFTLPISTTNGINGATVTTNFYIKFDSEEMRITGVNTAANQITVQRAQLGTSAATHAQGAVGTTHSSHLLLNDNTLANPIYIATPLWVTSPTTFVCQSYRKNSGTLTAAFAQTYDPASFYYVWTMPDQPGFPYGAAAQVVSQIPGCNFHVNIPPGATNDLVWAIAREVRDNMTAGRKVMVEWGNEVWNSGYNNYIFAVDNSRLLFASGQPYKYTARRHKECHDIFIAAFNEGGRNRGSEIVRLFPSQYFNSGVTSGILNQAIADGAQVDQVALAPYFTMDSAANLIIDACDNEQAIDYWLFDLWYSWKAVVNAYSFNTAWAAQAAAIASYADATKSTPEVVTYEGGIQAALPGTSVNYLTRSRDLVYNPNWYIAEQDIYAWLQSKGFTTLCIYAYGITYNTSGRSLWGLYHGDQDYGRGDGSDGKLNNLLCLAEPGKPNSKASTTSLEVNTVSVRGQAVRDWINGVNADPPVVTITAPASGATVSGTVTITATATSVNTITSVELFVDNVSQGTDTTSPYSFSWNSAATNNGSHTIKVQATDNLGTTGSSSIPVTVSNTSLINSMPNPYKSTAQRLGASV